MFFIGIILSLSVVFAHELKFQFYWVKSDRSEIHLLRSGTLQTNGIIEIPQVPSKVMDHLKYDNTFKASFLRLFRTFGPFIRRDRKELKEIGHENAEWLELSCAVLYNEKIISWNQMDIDTIDNGIEPLVYKSIRNGIPHKAKVYYYTVNTRNGRVKITDSNEFDTFAEINIPEGGKLKQSFDIYKSNIFSLDIVKSLDIFEELFKDLMGTDSSDSESTDDDDGFPRVFASYAISYDNHLVSWDQSDLLSDDLKDEIIASINEYN